MRRSCGGRLRGVTHGASLLLGVVAIASPDSADFYDGGPGGHWLEPLNWAGDSVPTADDDALIQAFNSPATGDGAVDGADFLAWQLEARSGLAWGQQGAVPEPATGGLAGVVLLTATTAARQRRTRTAC